MAFRNGSFATFLIVCPTSFFLGIIFSLFPYDYPILWSTTPTPATHFDYFESHLRFLHASPPLIPRILHIVIFLGLAGLVTKLYRPSESNMLFDGASLVLYMCGVTVYIANIVKGLRLVSAGTYGDDLLAATAAAAGAGAGSDAPAEEGQILGREDSLKVLAASNTILALVLVGVLVLQAGQWYAERKEAQELASFKASSSSSKKEKEKEVKEDAALEKEEKEQQQQQQQQQGASSATTTGRLTRQASSRKKN